MQVVLSMLWLAFKVLTLSARWQCNTSSIWKKHHIYLATNVVKAGFMKWISSIALLIFHNQATNQTTEEEIHAKALTRHTVRVHINLKYKFPKVATFMCKVFL